MMSFFEKTLCLLSVMLLISLFFAVLIGRAGEKKLAATSSSSIKASIVEVVVINEDSIKSKKFLERFNVSDTIKGNYRIYVLNCE